jgi:hypothetical protein
MYAFVGVAVLKVKAEKLLRKWYAPLHRRLRIPRVALSRAERIAVQKKMTHNLTYPAAFVVLMMIQMIQTLSPVCTVTIVERLFTFFVWILTRFPADLGSVLCAHQHQRAKMADRFMRGVR